VKGFAKRLRRITSVGLAVVVTVTFSLSVAQAESAVGALPEAAKAAAALQSPAAPAARTGDAAVATSTPAGSSESTTTTVTPPPPAPKLKPKPKAKPKPRIKLKRAPSFMPKKGKAIYLDRRHQRVYLIRNGYIIDSFLCSTSRALPQRGTFHVLMQRKASRSFNGKVRFFWQTVFLKSKRGNNIAFHSIPINSRGHEIAPVGKPVSHGCVRVKLKKAKFIYYWIDKRTPIMVRP